MTADAHACPTPDVFTPATFKPGRHRGNIGSYGRRAGHGVIDRPGRRPAQAVFIWRLRVPLDPQQETVVKASSMAGLHRPIAWTPGLQALSRTRRRDRVHNHALVDSSRSRRRSQPSTASHPNRRRADVAASRVRIEQMPFLRAFWVDVLGERLSTFSQVESNPDRT